MICPLLLIPINKKSRHKPPAPHDSDFPIPQAWMIRFGTFKVCKSKFPGKLQLVTYKVGPP